MPSFFQIAWRFSGARFSHGQRVVVLLAELGQGLLAQLDGDLLDFPALGLDIEDLGQGFKFFDVLDLVRTFAAGGFQEALDHLPGVVGVGGGAGGNGAGEVAGRHGVGGGAADADHLLDTVDDLAGAHVAVPAAGAAGAEETGRHAAGFDPIIGGLDVLGDILGQDFLGRHTGDIRAAFTTISFDSHLETSIIFVVAR